MMWAHEGAARPHGFDAMRSAVVQVGKLILPAFQRDDRGRIVFELLKALHHSQIVLKNDEVFSSTVSDLYLNARAEDSLSNILSLVRQVANDSSAPLGSLIAEIAALDVNIPLESRPQLVDAASNLRDWVVSEGVALELHAFREAVDVHRQLSSLGSGAHMAAVEGKWSALLTPLA